MIICQPNGYYAYLVFLSERQAIALTRHYAYNECSKEAFLKNNLSSRKAVLVLRILAENVARRTVLYREELLCLHMNQIC